MSSTLLSIRNLSFQTGGKQLLDNLNLEVGHGEIHALLGTNGTGKTTLARVVMGCAGYEATSGEILFENHPINTLPLHERARLGITLAWQEPARFEGLLVQDYLRLGAKVDDTEKILAQVGLDPKIYMQRLLDKSLSGGERQRIELAAVVAMRPKLAILDEPAAGIDLLSIDEIISVVRTLCEATAGVLLISHRQEMARIAHRASLLCGGKIVFTGKPKAVINRYKRRSCVVCDGRVCTDESVA